MATSGRSKVHSPEPKDLDGERHDGRHRCGPPGRAGGTGLAADGEGKGPAPAPRLIVVGPCLVFGPPFFGPKPGTRGKKVFSGLNQPFPDGQFGAICFFVRAVC